MSITLLLLAQAGGQEVTTFYPLPSQQQEQKELRQAQGLPAPAPAPVPATTVASPPVKPVAEPTRPAQIKVVSVTQVPADANVVFQPASPQQPPK